MTDAGGGTDTEGFTITLNGADETPNTAPVIDVTTGGGSQASVLIHGVRFTVSEAGAAGNKFRVHLYGSTGTVDAFYTSVRQGGGTSLTFSFHYETNDNPPRETTSQDIIDLWAAQASDAIKRKITLTLDSEKTAVTSTLNEPPEDFTGGADPGSQASVVVHGVKFTVKEPGAAGNDYNLSIRTDSADEIRSPRAEHNRIYVSQSQDYRLCYFSLDLGKIGTEQSESPDFRCA